MRALWIACLLCAWVPANAGELPRNSVISPQPAMKTAAWLQLQREGQAASAQPQTLTPAEQERALKRWLDTFEQPIPERFEENREGSASR